MNDRPIAGAWGVRVLAIAPVCQHILVADAVRDYWSGRVVAGRDDEVCLRRKSGVRRPAERGERVVVDRRVVHDRWGAQYRRIAGLGDVAALIAHASLGRAGGITTCPTGRDLVHPDDVGVTTHRHLALRTERRVASEVDWRNTSEHADALPCPTAAGDSTSGTRVVAA